MKISGKYLCWVLLLAMLCAVSYGGCGGGSSNSDLGSDSGNSEGVTPETPPSPETEETPITQETPSDPVQSAPEAPEEPSPTPTPETPEDNGGSLSEEALRDFNGKWSIESGTLTYRQVTGDEETGVGYEADYEEGSVNPFDISVTKNDNDEYYTLNLTSDIGWYMIPVPLVRRDGSQDSIYTYAHLMDSRPKFYFVEENTIRYDEFGKHTYKLIDSSTIHFTLEMSGIEQISTDSGIIVTHGRYTMQLVLKRVS